MEVNEEKREKFMNYAGKRVNNIMHDIQILEPMSRSNAYDFTKEDVTEMFNAIQETLDNAKHEFEKKFERKEKAEKKIFTFGSSNVGNNNMNNDATIDSANETIIENVNDSNDIDN